MASEFMSSATERLVQALRSVGVSQEVAGMVAAEWQSGVEQEWGGERPYIGKSSTAAREMSARDRRIVQQYQAGERVPYLSRQHGISRQRVFQILETAGVYTPARKDDDVDASSAMP